MESTTDSRVPSKFFLTELVSTLFARNSQGLGKELSRHVFEGKGNVRFANVFTLKAKDGLLSFSCSIQELAY
jgi:hypothetical protein